MAKSVFSHNYINCTNGHSIDAGSGQYVRWSVRAAVSTCGGQYVRLSRYKTDTMTYRTPETTRPAQQLHIA